jgi:hypothetical protein
MRCLMVLNFWTCLTLWLILQSITSFYLSKIIFGARCNALSTAPEFLNMFYFVNNLKNVLLYKNGAQTVLNWQISPQYHHWWWQHCKSITLFFLYAYNITMENLPPFLASVIWKLRRRCWLLRQLQVANLLILLSATTLCLVFMFVFILFDWNYSRLWMQCVV